MNLTKEELLNQLHELCKAYRDDLLDMQEETQNLKNELKHNGEDTSLVDVQDELLCICLSNFISIQEVLDELKELEK